jgi:cytochrome P450
VLQHEVFLVTDPSLIQEVLQTKASFFVKSADYRNLKAVFGSGLLTSDGPAWLEQRRMLQPAFNHSRLDSYAKLMLGSTRDALDKWCDGDVRDIHQDMMGLTLKIVAQTLFATDVPGQIQPISDAVSAVFRDLSASSMFIPALRYLPTPKNLRWRRSVNRLNQIIRGLLYEARRAPNRAEGLLGMLLNARDSAGSPLNDLQIRDELMTMFLAGHETTAVALSWTLHLLSMHPRVESVLRDEISRIDFSSATVQHQIASLPYTRAVLQESMRLYPPVWTIGREAKSPVEIGGHTLPSGAQVWICQWIVHHDSRFFPSPDEFMPERWLGDNTGVVARFRYLPFGAGLRVCIGQSFAMLEAAIILVCLLQRFRLSRPSGKIVRASPWFTLRPAEGVPMVVTQLAQVTA